MAVPQNSALGRAIQKLAGAPIFAKIGPKIVPKVDRFLHRVTGGRFMSAAGAVPSLMLNVRGAKTGRMRQTPLATLPMGDAWYVVGSNFGRESHPLWTGNLLAYPDASIDFKRETIEVRGHLLTAQEKAAVWPELIEVWPNYDVYVERSKRDLRVFRLDRR